MKLKINKASDLSSISVLPPQSRKSSNTVGSGLDSSSIYGRSQTMASQFRSQQQQSQLSFSQGISSQQFPYSQFSQNSQDETLTLEKLGSQERDNSAKRAAGLPPIGYAREENQVMLSRNSSNLIRKWPGPEQKRQTSEELEHRMGMVETSLNRLGMIMDSVQSDIMQVNKGTKEVALEMDGTRQKLVAHDGALQLLNKGQEEIKNRLDMALKTLSDQIKQNMNQDNLQEILSMLSSLVKSHTDMSKDFNQKIQDLTCSLQILKQEQATPSVHIPNMAAICCVPSQQVQIPNKVARCIEPNQQVQIPNKVASCIVPNQQVQIRNKAASCFVPTQQVQIPNTVKRQALKESLVAKVVPKVEVGGWKSVKQERSTTRAENLRMRNNPIKVSPSHPITGSTIVIESDEETDCGFFCLLKEKGSVAGYFKIMKRYFVSQSSSLKDFFSHALAITLKQQHSCSDKESSPLTVQHFQLDGHLIEESDKETARILRKARQRKRKYSNTIIIN